MIDPSWLTLLGGAGSIGLLIKSVLYYIDRERDRRALLSVLKNHKTEDVEVVARSLRALRFRKNNEAVDSPDEKPAVEAPKPTLAIEAPKPHAPPEDGPPRAA